MRITLTKIHLPQLIRTEGGYMIIHYYEGNLIISEFTDRKKAEEEYTNTVSFYYLKCKDGAEQSY